MKLESFGIKFIVHLSNFELKIEDQQLLENLKPIGIFLDARNFLPSASYQDWHQAIKTLITEATRLTGRDKLIVAIDHEGGRVIRTPNPITKLPYAEQYVNKAGEVAKIVATELKSFGVNLLFGPVADLNSNPNNPVIGARCFGSNIEKVNKALSEYCKEIIQSGLLPVAKHFPGHGDTETDSHYHLPVIKHDLEKLKYRELVPFEMLIQQGISAIMTAHILFPMIDPIYPATLSKAILNDLLRIELGFKGVVISDDIDMEGLSKNFTDEEIVLQAAKAGLDLFLFNHCPERALKFSEILLKESNKNQELKKALEQSNQRILKFLKNIKKSSFTILPDAIFSKHAKMVLK